MPGFSFWHRQYCWLFFEKLGYYIWQDGCWCLVFDTWFHVPAKMDVSYWFSTDRFGNMDVDAWFAFLAMWVWHLIFSAWFVFWVMWIWCLVFDELFAFWQHGRQRMPALSKTAHKTAHNLYPRCFKIILLSLTNVFEILMVGNSGCQWPKVKQLHSTKLVGVLQDDINGSVPCIAWVCFLLTDQFALKQWIKW